MLKTVSMALGLSLLASTAMAADLPRRSAPPVPVFVAQPTTGFYVGVRGGYAFTAEDYVLGASVGYDFGAIRTELAYDYLGGRKDYVYDYGYGYYGRATSINLLTGNLILEHTMGNWTPYLLAGAGVAFTNGNGYGFRYDDTVGVYVLGGGLRYSITSNLDVDARYRYVNTFESGWAMRRDGEHIGTIGVNYRF